MALYYMALSESHRRTPATTRTWERLFLSALSRRDCAPGGGGYHRGALPMLLGLFFAPAVDRWVERFDAWVEGR